nr:uncharacterized protein LOC103449801 [Malus domestica]
MGSAPALGSLSEGGSPRARPARDCQPFSTSIMEQPEVGDSLLTFLDDPQPQPKLISCIGGLVDIVFLRVLCIISTREKTGNFKIISLCDLEKQIGKENHAEHASQCAPEQGLDKENHAEHAPLCVPEKCIEKEYQEILSFRNVLSKLSLEEQKLIEGYWTNATQTGDLFWNGLDSHNRTVGREDLGHLLSDAEISNGVVDSYAVLLTEDMLRDGVSNQFVMSRYAWKRKWRTWQNLILLPWILLGRTTLPGVVDAKIHLEAGNLGETIKEENNASSQDLAKAMNFIRRHLNHQKTMILPRTRYEWTHLRIQDFKTMAKYNSVMFRISS